LITYCCVWGSLRSWGELCTVCLDSNQEKPSSLPCSTRYDQLSLVYDEERRNKARSIGFGVPVVTEVLCIGSSSRVKKAGMALHKLNGARFGMLLNLQAEELTSAILVRARHIVGDISSAKASFSTAKRRPRMTKRTSRR
jgi:hypothetical protein